MLTNLNMTADVDRELAWERGDSRRYLRVRIDSSAPADTTKRAPMNLVLAIDASGSMRGDKIAAARRAAAGSLSVLRSDDLLTVVSFADDVIVHIAQQPMTETGRAAAQKAIFDLETRGRTNLSEGWFKGVIAATEETDIGHKATRVVLLSDGYANLGITNPSELAMHAEQLLARGVTTSALGIGDGYDERLLGTIAEAGGGRLLDAELDDEIETVLLAELGASAATVADALVLWIELPARVRADVLGRTEARRQLDGLEIPLGALISGCPREVYVGLTLPAGEAGETVPLNVRLNGKDTATGSPLPQLSAGATITFAEAAANSPQPREEELSLGAARAWMAQMMRRMAELNAEGRIPEAQDYLSSQTRYFTRYIEGLRGSEPLLKELSTLRANADRHWSPRMRKEINYAASRRVNAYSDFRGQGKRAWSDRLNDG